MPSAPVVGRFNGEMACAAMPANKPRASSLFHRRATHVAGWRSAVLLRDPSGVAAELKRLAHDWSWDRVASDCDAWVSGWVVGMAEDAQQLVSSAHAGDDLSAAAICSYLASRLSRVMALHRRILYASDKALWEAVAAELGPEWRRALRSALGLDRDTPLARATFALRLYELAATEASGLLDERQQAVVSLALSTAEHL